MSLDPRAQLAALAAVVLGALFGGTVGVAAAALVAAATLVASRAVMAGWRVALAVAPLAAAVLALDAIAGEVIRGGLAASRLVALALAGCAFARTADAEALVAALRWLRVPYAMTFVIVTGARLVPLTAADLADLRDAARLRGVDLDGAPASRLAGWRRLLVPLVVASIRRALRLGEAMEVRGFVPGRPRTERAPLRWRGRDTLALVAACAYAAVILALTVLR